MEITAKDFDLPEDENIVIQNIDYYFTTTGSPDSYTFIYSDNTIIYPDSTLSGYTGDSIIYSNNTLSGYTTTVSYSYGSSS